MATKQLGKWRLSLNTMRPNVRISTVVSTKRRIAHLDMDAFFASVELLRYPELRGKPVVVGGRSAPAPRVDEQGECVYARLRDYRGRGVVTTSTYEARAFGVFSAMPMMKAAKLAPEAFLLPANFDAYRDYSRRFKAAVARVADHIEDRGIDEIYIDLTDMPQPSEELGQELKQAVREATGLTCSIAISPNKLLSKIGSELDKPDGLTLLDWDDVPRRIWPLPVGKVNGIGPKASARLADMDIHTIGDLAASEPARLCERFSASYSDWLIRVAQGIDDNPVVRYADPKSVSRETTFSRDLHARHDRDELSAYFTRLCEQIAEQLQRKCLLSRTIGIKLRYQEFRTVTRDITLEEPTGDAGEIRRAAGECLKRVSLDQKLRLLGVRCSALVSVQESSGDQTQQLKLPLDQGQHRGR